MEATTCTDGEPAAAAITLDRLLQDVSNPENPHRVQIIHQINSYLHDAAHRQQELDEEAVKQFAALLYDHDHEVVESLLGQIFPLLLQEQHIQEWIAQALPHILAQRRGHAKAVDALLRKVLERMPADAVLDGIILAVSTNPFVLFRPLYGYQKEKELRLFIQRRGLEWLRDIMDMRDDAGEAALNIPPNYTHSLLNRIIPLCELLAEEEQAALGQVLRSLHTQSSAVFGAVLTTFDSLIQAKVAAMVPEYEMAADDDAMEEVQECRPEERDGAGDLSFAMPSFSQYEKEDSSFAMVCHGETCYVFGHVNIDTPHFTARGH